MATEKHFAIMHKIFDSSAPDVQGVEIPPEGWDGEDNHWIEWDEDPREHFKGEGTEVVLVGDEGHPLIFEDGVLVLAGYASYRGVYQGGAFDGGQGYFITNAGSIWDLENDKWYSDWEGGCPSIAQNTWEWYHGKKWEEVAKEREEEEVPTTVTFHEKSMDDPPITVEFTKRDEA